MRLHSCHLRQRELSRTSQGLDHHHVPVQAQEADEKKDHSDVTDAIIHQTPQSHQEIGAIVKGVTDENRTLSTEEKDLHVTTEAMIGGEGMNDTRSTDMAREWVVDTTLPQRRQQAESRRKR